jgi:hypothetical protein
MPPASSQASMREASAPSVSTTAALAWSRSSSIVKSPPMRTKSGRSDSSCRSEA